jgi:antitoxin StbD
MTSVSISDFKKNPASVLSSAEDYPVAVLKRNKTAGYVVGKDIFEKLIELVENLVDKKAKESLTKSDYENAVSLEDLAKELGLE